MINNTSITPKFTRNLIICVELLVIISLSFAVYEKFVTSGRREVLGVTKVTPLDKDDYEASPSAELKYYFEPKSNTKIIEESIVWLEKPVVYNINLDALNERRDYSVQKPQGVFRIITLGDSFTFGSYVNTADNWTEMLEDELNNLHCNGIKYFETINLGVGGYGPEYIKERYLIRGKKYNPDLIIWNESGGDFDRVNELLQPLIEKRKENMTEDEILQDLNEGKHSAWFEALDELNKLYSYDERVSMVAKSWEEFYQIRGEVPVLVTAPIFLTKNQRAMLYDWGKGHENVNYYLNLPNTDKEGLHLLDGHPNEDGHKAIAESTLNYLKENYLTNCD